MREMLGYVRAKSSDAAVDVRRNHARKPEAIRGIFFVVVSGDRKEERRRKEF